MNFLSWFSGLFSANPPPSSGGSPNLNQRRPVPIFPLVSLVIVCCLTYSISQFLRNSTGVIAPDLATSLMLAPESLGVLSGAFFLSFALSQPLLGILLDRIGPRIVMSAGLAVTVAGCLLFALADGLATLTLARVVMGVGCSPLLMGPMVLYSRWMPHDRFATITALQFAVGSMGTVIATLPLAIVADSIGWRGAFLIAAVFTAVMGTLVWTTIRNAPPAHPIHHAPRQTWRQDIAIVRQIIQNRDIVRLMPLAFVGYASFVALVGLWAAPYLADVHGLDLRRRGEILFVMAAAQVFGMIGWGPIDRIMNSRKKPIAIGAGIAATSLAVLAIWPTPPLFVVAGLFAAFGLFSGYSIILFAHARGLFPDSMVGRGITILNMGNMLGAFTMQGFAGVLIGAFDDLDIARPVSYRAAFFIMSVILAAAIAVYLTAADAPPRAPARENAPK